MTLKTTILFLLLGFFTWGKSQDQPYFLKQYPDTLNKRRLTYLIGGQSFVYATSLTVLYQAWYKDYPQSGFHWIDDNGEWLQMDKIGHATTSAYFGKFGYEMYRWAGVERKKAIWIGGSAGFVFLTVIEILDGFSAQWGASIGDFVANAAGTGLFIGQQLAWNDQRLNLKWSFHPTDYAQYRPDQLGSSFVESMLKDYNGQTYWLSGNVKSFLPKRSKFPGWLNVSLGYSGEGMLGANSNPSDIDGVPIPEFPRYRQYFLSFDVDLPRIKTRSHFLKFLFNGLNFIKVPFPTLEYNKEEGFRFHPLYF
ncbi:MAG: YfiM family protein [Bacteroidales bacterium]|nr:YfiM family protein [Bacteroidales bacterium]